eukprot:1414491-Rhodomonas_salina.3
MPDLGFVGRARPSRWWQCCSEASPRVRTRSGRRYLCALGPYNAAECGADLPVISPHMADHGGPE